MKTQEKNTMKPTMIPKLNQIQNPVFKKEK